MDLQNRARNTTLVVPVWERRIASGNLALYALNLLQRGALVWSGQDRRHPIPSVRDWLRLITHISIIRCEEVHDLQFATHDMKDTLVAHRTFFSFHYERDVQRASVVRNSSKLKRSINPEWIEASLWESAKATSHGAVKRLIDDGLKGTTVTAVLIGAETASRRWVNYEIDRSIDRGNGLIGIYIHNIKYFDGNADIKGINPLPSGYRTYDWIYDDGFNNLGTWVDEAYDAAN